MTEIKILEPIQKTKDFNQLDLLFKIHRLKKIRRKLSSKLSSIEQLIISENQENYKHRFQALKTIISENDINYKQVTSQLKDCNNLYKFCNILKENNQYLLNLKKERKKGRIDSEAYELTKGHYLQKIIDIKNNFEDLKTIARLYFQELKDEVISSEDKRIQIITERTKKAINKKEFNEKIKENDDSKQLLEEKLAFLKVKIIDYELE